MDLNIEQVKSGVGWFVTTFGGFIAGWFAAKGWFTVDQVTSVLNSPAIIGGVASVIIFVWRLLVHRESNAVKVAAVIAERPGSPVRGIVLEHNHAGLELAALVGSSAAVPAGSSAAAAIARAP